MNDRVAFQLTIYGHVQGIGYRWFVKDIAKEENLSGYVKNNQDGTVEIIVESDKEEKVNRFIERIKKEHPYAVVKKVEIKKINPTFYDDFIIKF
ncbi:MAG: acylphosphatase [Endomicrobiia bacterium]